MIDAHTHLFSWPYWEALAKLSPLPGTPEERLTRMAAASGIELPSKDLATHVARWIADMDKHGVERAVSFASIGDEIPAVLEAAALSKGRLIPFAILDCRADGAADKAKALFASKGCRGLLLFPAMHHYRMSGPEAAAVLAAADASRATVFVQCGLLQVRARDLLGLPRRTDLSFANPLDVIPAANAFPNASFVVPHFGAGFLRETLMLGAQCSNAFVDTSSSNSWIAIEAPTLTLTDVFRRALDVFGPDRILFGTDSSTFPRGWRKDLHAAQCEALLRCGASDSVREKIFGANTARLIDRSP